MLLTLPCYPYIFDGFYLLLSALAQGSEVRVYSHKVRMYIRACVVGHAQGWHTECRYILQVYIGHTYVRHTVWHIQIHVCSTQILIADNSFFGNEDGGQWWQCGGAIAAWILQTASVTANVTRATCASPAPVYIHTGKIPKIRDSNTYMTCAHSLRTGARQRCTFVFLVYIRFLWFMCYLEIRNFYFLILEHK